MHVEIRKKARQESAPKRAAQGQFYIYIQAVEEKRKRDVYRTHLCYNPEYKAKEKRQYMSKCDIFNNQTKIKNMEQYCRAKRAGMDNTRKNSCNMNRITDTPPSPQLSIFRASFASGSIETGLMSDQGGEAKFIYAIFLIEIKQ